MRTSRHYQHRVHLIGAETSDGVLVQGSQGRVRHGAVTGGLQRRQCVGDALRTGHPLHIIAGTAEAHHGVAFLAVVDPEADARTRSEGANAVGQGPGDIRQFRIGSW
ncbi:Uncharacterised protein [Mycobacteroides abscessus subsp. abscessus]|nr:Uncharacterised protein [Mycobacteroides abscessus subsp. abscessus]